jgi:hypothetical protein
MRWTLGFGIAALEQELSVRGNLLGLVAFLLVGCHVTVSPAPNAAVERRARVSAPLTPIRGAVTAPSSLLGVDAGSLVGPDGSGLLGLDAGSLLGVDAGTLRTLAQAGHVPLARTVVLLAGPDGRPVEPRVQTVTDAQGRYTLQARGRGGIVVALARSPERRLVRLSGLLHPGAQGQVAVSPATTLVTAALMAEVNGTPRNFSAVRPVDYQAAVEGVAGAAAELPSETLAAADALLAVAREAIRTSEAGSAGFGRLVERLTAAVYDPEAAEPAAATPSLSPASAAPEAALERVGELSPTSQATPSTAGLEAAPSPTPTASPTQTPTEERVVITLNAKPPRGDCATPTYGNVTLEDGDLVTISATGTVRLASGANANAFGPDGGKPLPPSVDGCPVLAGEFPRAALVVRFGQAAPWELVGSGPTEFKGKTGKVILAVNDSRAADNSGSFEVTIEVIRAAP